jgi:hypothetical protein
MWRRSLVRDVRSTWRRRRSRDMEEEEQIRQAAVRSAATGALRWREAASIAPVRRRGARSRRRPSWRGEHEFAAGEGVSPKPDLHH